MSLNYQGLPAYNEAISICTLTNSVDLGSVRILNGEEYVYCYNDGGASITVGYGVVMSGNTGYSVTVTSTTGTGAFIGVVKHATVPTAAYFWALSRGYTSVKNAQAGTALAVGAMLAPAANGTAQEHTGALTAPIFGTVVQATGSAGTAYAFVRCFGV